MREIVRIFGYELGTIKENHGMNNLDDDEKFDLDKKHIRDVLKVNC
jgi:hypothetical protein